MLHFLMFFVFFSLKGVLHYNPVLISHVWKMSVSVKNKTKLDYVHYRKIFFYSIYKLIKKYNHSCVTRSFLWEYKRVPMLIKGGGISTDAGNASVRSDWSKVALPNFSRSLLAAADAGYSASCFTAQFVVAA